MPDVIAHGELLIDFISTAAGLTVAAAPSFVKAPGGAPANVAVGLARLGVSSGFMGQVGDDPFGHFLAETLQQNGVDVSALRFSAAARTMLAFVSLSAGGHDTPHTAHRRARDVRPRAGGEPDFVFYRHPSADMLYAPAQVDAKYIRAARVFHFGSISLTGEPARSATLRAVSIAREAGLLISYDPNLRLNLWPDAGAARDGLLIGWPHAQVAKLSEEELRFLGGDDDLTRAARRLWHDGLRLLVVTRGPAGCRYFTPTASGNVTGFSVPTIDTTGAGDGFMAGLLKGILEQPRAFESEARLRAVCRFANAAGALTTTRHGAIPALPKLAEVQSLLVSR